MLYTSAHQIIEREAFFKIIQASFDVMRMVRGIESDDHTYYIVAAIVTREPHQGGGFHLHCACKLECPVEMIGADFLMLIRAALPDGHKQLNATAARRGQKWQALCNYVLKEDPNPFFYNVNRSDLASPVQAALHMIMQAPNWPAVLTDTEHCEVVAGKLNWAHEVFEHAGRMRQHWRYKEMIYPLSTFRDRWSADWCSMIRAHIARLLSPWRRFKDRAVYLWGPPGTRKSCAVVSILDDMGLLPRTYFAPIRHGDWDDYNDETCDLIVCDEFNLKFNNVPNINLALQGSPWTVNAKYRRVQHSRRYKPWIFISNYEPCLPDDPELEAAFRARITSYGLDDTNDMTVKHPLVRLSEVADENMAYDVNNFSADRFANGLADLADLTGVPPDPLECVADMFA